MSTEVTLHKKQNLDVWGTDFERAQRMAQALSQSAIFPKQFSDVGSCLIVLDMAQRLEMSPMEVAQNIDIIHGKPGWKSAYLIDMVTNSPAWTDVEYTVTVEGKVTLPKGGGQIENKVGRYSAKRASDGKTITGNPVSYAMAISEGWWDRKDSKWPNMPEQMLQYRAIAFFNRTNPTVRTYGLHSADEVQDSEDVVITTIPTPHRKPQAAPVAAKPPQSPPEAPPRNDQPAAQVLVRTVAIEEVPATSEAVAEEPPVLGQKDDF